MKHLAPGGLTFRRGIAPGAEAGRFQSQRGGQSDWIWE
jgi:hypothetical protein